jgi:chromosome segregation ATPase
MNESQTELDSLRTQLATAQAEANEAKALMSLARKLENVERQQRNQLQAEVERLSGVCVFREKRIENLLSEVRRISTGAVLLTESLNRLQSDLTKRNEVLRVALRALLSIYGEFEYEEQDSMLTRRGKVSKQMVNDALTAIQSCLNTTSEGEK